MSRGALIVVEGIDKSGKSTLASSLVDRLQATNCPAMLVCFPDRATPIGRLITGYLTRTFELTDQGLHLLMSTNRWEKVKHIKHFLDQGVTIVCDRYCYSGVAYSLAKEDPHMGMTWCKTPDSGLPQPDLVLFLDLDPEEAFKRSSFGDEIYEESEFQKKVREKYALLREEDANSEKERTWTVLDASQCQEELVQEAADWAGKCDTSQPLGRMWIMKEDESV